MKLIKIGKSHSNDIVIDSDNTVSRIHLEIFIDDERNVFVTDKNSLNGTFVNGNRIYEPKKLSRYDILRIGNTLINWRDYLEAEDERVYETVADGGPVNTSTYHNKDNNESDTIKKNRRRNKIYFWSLVSIVILVLVAYFYFTQDSIKITTTWKAKDKSGLSYTFYEDGTFEKDSNDVIKTGTYSLKTGRENKIELEFDKESLPVFINILESDNTNKYPFPDEVDFDRPFENFFGNIFKLKNNSDFDIKILRLTQQTIKPEFQNVTSRIYISDRDYNQFFNKSRDFPDYSYSKYENWELVSEFNSNISSNKFIHEDISDLIIEEGSEISFMTVTNDYVSVSIGTEKENDDLSILESRRVQTYQGNFYSSDKYSYMWNGNIEYGLMKSEYSIDYEFVGGNLNLNGKLFKRK